MKKQELGPRQLKWVESLEAHPERQISGLLATKCELTIGKQKVPYLACCLGEAILVKNRLQKKRFNFDHQNNLVHTEAIDGEFLDTHTVNYYKFYDTQGIGKIDTSEIYMNELGGYESLYKANDNSVSWTDIAKFIRKYPEAVFKESI